MASLDSLDPQLEALVSHRDISAGVGAALLKAPGARFYKCALQVNPYEYAKRHAKKNAFASEAGYNSAILAACRSEGIEVVAITDHFRVATAKNLADILRRGGINVFLGFEASSSEGVHILCPFPGIRHLMS